MSSRLSGVVSTLLDGLKSLQKGNERLWFNNLTILKRISFEKRGYEKTLREVPVNVVLYFESAFVAGPRVTCPVLL